MRLIPNGLDVSVCFSYGYGLSGDLPWFASEDQRNQPKSAEASGIIGDPYFHFIDLREMKCQALVEISIFKSTKCRTDRCGCIDSGLARSELRGCQSFRHLAGDVVLNHQDVIEWTVVGSDRGKGRIDIIDRVANHTAFGERQRIMVGPTNRQSASLSDYLAAERTMLAWIRTGLALMGFGFVVARFGLFLQQLHLVERGLPANSDGWSLWFGTALIVAGVIVNVFAGWHHMRLVKALDRGETSHARSSLQAVAIAFFLGLVGLAMAIYLVSVRSSAHSDPGSGKVMSMMVAPEMDR